MALLIIQQDCPTHEARDWLAELTDAVLNELDLEECVEAINGDKIAEEMMRQIGYLPGSVIDRLFTNAVESLTE